MNLQSQSMLRTSYEFLYFTLGILRSESEIIYSPEFTAVHLHFQVSKSKWMLLGELCHMRFLCAAIVFGPPEIKFRKSVLFNSTSKISRKGKNSYRSKFI